MPKNISINLIKIYIYAYFLTTIIAKLYLVFNFLAFFIKNSISSIDKFILKVSSAWNKFIGSWLAFYINPFDGIPNSDIYFLIFKVFKKFDLDYLFFIILITI